VDTRPFLLGRVGPGNEAVIEENEAVYQATAEPRILVTHAFASVTHEDCLNYIRHAGYME